MSVTQQIQYTIPSRVYECYKELYKETLNKTHDEVLALFLAAVAEGDVSHDEVNNLYKRYPTYEFTGVISDYVYIPTRLYDKLVGLVIAGDIYCEMFWLHLDKYIHVFMVGRTHGIFHNERVLSWERLIEGMW